jgi:hypothetical protein
MNEIENAKQDFLQAKGALMNAFAHTPDDRLNWSPSPTARTPIQLAAHAASGFTMIHKQIAGTPFHIKDPKEADIHFREWERQFSTREQVNQLIEDNSAEYVTWLDSLTPESLEGNWILPFGLGEMPKAMSLGIVPMHTRTHVAQIEYIQTILGDHDWHMGG